MISGFLYFCSMERLKPIMLVGTGSDVGKSLICAGLSRVFKQEGFDPAPFKGQNMSLNSFPTPDGFEIGRAQAVQAEAAGLSPMAEMNPLLLKPTGDKTAQVVLNGKPAGNESAEGYFKKRDRKKLMTEVLKAFDTLAERFNPLVIEGAGSIAEVNLREQDITNMQLALEREAAVYLVADIERGGIFGSVYGTLELLPAPERDRIEGIIVNRFRGDPGLFAEGRKKLEELTGLPLIGVLPYYTDVTLDEEDSVPLGRKTKQAEENKRNVAAVLLEHLSNFTDMNVLERDERVHLYYTDDPQELEKADLIILPGSKNTIRDLKVLREKGLVEPILKAYEQGKKVIGICGGYQMMGKWVHDPEKVEGNDPSMPGLGLLPVETVLEEKKTTEQCTFRFREIPQECRGYQIHMGRTTATEETNPSPLALIHEEEPDGYFLNDRCWGTYIHGILDNRTVLDDLLKGVTSANGQGSQDPSAYKEAQYERLAAHLREDLDLSHLFQTLRS